MGHTVYKWCLKKQFHTAAFYKNFYFTGLLENISKYFKKWTGNIRKGGQLSLGRQNSMSSGKQLSMGRKVRNFLFGDTLFGDTSSWHPIINV
jgi:hypothetical protein